jgi:tetratricopeptide (TPR) repeat protein
MVVIGVWLAHAAPASAQLATSMNESNRALQDAISLDLQGWPKQAEVQYRRAILLNPHNIEAYRRFSAFLFFKRRFREGLELVRSGLKNNPGHLELRAMLGMHLYRLGRIEQAYKELKAGISRLPRYDVQVLLSRCAFLLEDYATTVKTLRAYLASRPSSLAKKDYAFKTRLAVALMRSGRPGKAREILDGVQAKRPRYKRARQARAELLLHQKRCREAAKALKDQIARYPKVDELQLQLASAHFCLRRYEQALDGAERYLQRREGQLKRLTARPPGRRYVRGARIITKALQLRGDAAMKLRRHELALRDFKLLDTITHGSEEAVLKVVQVLFSIKAYDRVVRRLAPELKKPATSQRLIVLALRAAVRARNKAVALQCAGRLLRLKDPAYYLYYYAGMAQNSAGEFNSAIVSLERALSLNPRHRWSKVELVRAYSYQAKRLLRSRRIADALELVRKALKLAPKEPVLRRDLAILYILRGDGKRALRHAKRLVDLEPKSALAVRLLGRALALLGKHKRAILSYRQARQGLKGESRRRALFLLEEGISLVQARQAAVGIARLEEAARLTASTPEAAEHALISQTLIRARILAAKELLVRGKPLEAKRALARVSKKIDGLSLRERAMVQALITIATVLSGKPRVARRLIKRSAEQLKVGLQPPYDQVGGALLSAYADARSPYTAARIRAATKLEQVAAKVPAAARDMLRADASAILHTIAFRYYRQGRRRQARQILTRAHRLSKMLSPLLRHNKAVVDYYTGQQDAALQALQTVGKQVPLAYCNLAVHYERRGDRKRAYDLFTQCDKRGVRSFPGLKQILEIKQQIRGEEE